LIVHGSIFGLNGRVVAWRTDSCASGALTREYPPDVLLRRRGSRGVSGEELPRLEGADVEVGLRGGRGGHRHGCHPRDSVQFARDIAEREDALISDPDLAQRFGEAGRQRVIERFTWRAVAERTTELYRSLVS
jgi:hypothetical protein